MHAGYPLMAIENVEVVNAFLGPSTTATAASYFWGLGGLNRGAMWGIFHELGHNFQSKPWGLPGTGETTCNLWSLYLMEKIGVPAQGQPHSSAHGALANRDDKIRAYLATTYDVPIKGAQLRNENQGCLGDTHKLGETYVGGTYKTYATPALCAPAADLASQCSGTFMFATTVPSWGCLCCSPGDIAADEGTAHSRWAVYDVVDDVASASPDFDGEWKVWTALFTYLQLQEAFGWTFYTTVFDQYRAMDDDDKPTNDEEKTNEWVLRTSVVANKNLGPFYTSWGFDISDAVLGEIDQLDDWEDNPMAAL